MINTCTQHKEKEMKCLNKTEAKILNEIQKYGKDSTWLEEGTTAGGWYTKKHGTRKFNAAKKLVEANIILQVYESSSPSSIQRGERLNGYTTYTTYGFGGEHTGDAFKQNKEK